MSINNNKMLYNYRLGDAQRVWLCSLFLILANIFRTQVQHLTAAIYFYVHPWSGPQACDFSSWMGNKGWEWIWLRCARMHLFHGFYLPRSLFWKQWWYVLSAAPCVVSALVFVWLHTEKKDGVGGGSGRVGDVSVFWTHTQRNHLSFGTSIHKQLVAVHSFLSFILASACSPSHVAVFSATEQTQIPTLVFVMWHASSCCYEGHFVLMSMTDASSPFENDALHWILTVFWKYALSYIIHLRTFYLYAGPYFKAAP